ncbi:hypothetical protein [Gymnodinialimonas ceratoperidinii]|uniref:Uncharacterized protein n=1 Tax=Gymnodinialimonas ceratoperidinii TaxID=2856823 RepID=A0A8F6TX31_9RHOB|nr:hypothetical protein [Gymnodinialimonas ceratoperidinii]QXT39754.1 hypothetical protein KYE46_00380 [Gymnodinialimonas ceratoperidinii]
MKLLAYLLLLLGFCMGLIAAFVIYAAWTDFTSRGCPGAAQCSDAVSVMVLTGCALIASAVMLFAAVVFARR